jgi:hypothetical protein
MNKILRLLVVIFLLITLVGCSEAATKTEYETYNEAPKMMTIVDSTSGYTIYRHDETGVHYFSRDSGYGKAVCVMVNADGSPYTGERKDNG